MEILIVVIIIGILAGLMALSAGSSTETAEKTACRGDRRTIKSAYYVERAENGKTFKESLKKAMEQFTKGKQLAIAEDRAVYDGICHAGGLYIWCLCVFCHVVLFLLYFLFVNNTCKQGNSCGGDVGAGPIYGICPRSVE